MFGLSSSIVIDIAGIDTVKENRVLADKNHVLAIIVGQIKSREQKAAIGVECWRNLRIGFIWII